VPGGTGACPEERRGRSCLDWPWPPGASRRTGDLDRTVAITDHGDIPLHLSATVRRRAPILVLTSLAAAALVACGGSDDPDAVVITTLSNRADLVSDGDVLVRIDLPAGATGSTLKVDVGGRDVTSAFVASNGGYVGRVTGLAVGANALNASADGASAATLTVTNASRGGPIYSGAQITPFYCATPTPQAASGVAPATVGSGLSTAATDAQCNTATEFKLWYRTTSANCSTAIPDPSPPATAPANPCFKPYTASATPPSDLATTTTDTGLTVPYVVRVERGVMNRGIYDIAVLYDPTKPWTPTAPQPQWNGKIWYAFGASTGQPRRQVRPATAWSSQEIALAKGHAVLVNSMTDSARNANRVSMAETTMMMKEHVIDTYGPVRFTVGTGCSGGSINSNMNASISPGTLDGVIISCTYPDSETTGIEVADCTVLVEAYQRSEWLGLTGGLTAAQQNAKKAAINGHPDQTGCHGWFNAFGSNGKAGVYNQRTVQPASNATGVISTSSTAMNNCELPNAAVYDPVTNPTGPRCNAWSWQESVYGKANATQANDPRDNVGVQYGLKALQSGAITAEEFVTLNEIVGGTDRDSTARAARTAADTAALTVSYRAGIVMDSRQYQKTAVIDLRGYDDSALTTPPGAAGPATTPIHFTWRSFNVRDRLQRDAGNTQSHALWRFGRFGLLPTAAVTQDAFASMDAWMTALKANTSTTTSVADKVRAARPASAADFCYLSTDAAQSTKVTTAATCDADPFLKPSASPRQVAGGARTEDALKCQLKPIAVADYAPATLTTAQQARLAAVFPGGVCDWSKPGVEQQPSAGPLTFAAGPGGQPLPAAPVSMRR
jgi:hypothetical protein